MSEQLQKSMSADRKAAALIGVLYISGTVAFVLSAVVTMADQLALGSLLVLLAGFALAMVPVVFWPVGRRHSETLAMGYIVFRGAIETILYIGIALGWLVLLMLSAEPGAGRMADLVRSVLAVTSEQLLGIPFALGALLFYALLHRSRLVPRWLSAWGLVGGVLYLVAPILAMLGSPNQFLMGPLAVQEMVLAVWLIARGFSAATVATESSRDLSARRLLTPSTTSAASP